MCIRDRSCAGAPITNTGYGTNNITGALLAKKVNTLRLNNISIKNVAGWAAKVTGSNILITNCEFSYTGAGGLSFQGDSVSVERCGIHDLGRLYFGAVGIMASGENNRVANCELYN